MDGMEEERSDGSNGEFYLVVILKRDGGGQTRDDYHATVTRGSDKKKLVYISDFRWLLKWKVRRRALARAYKYHDKRDEQMAEVERLER